MFPERSSVETEQVFRGLGALHGGKYHIGICILPWGQWCCSDSLRNSISLRSDRVPEANSVTFLYTGYVCECVWSIHEVIIKKLLVIWVKSKLFLGKKMPCWRGGKLSKEQSLETSHTACLVIHTCAGCEPQVQQAHPATKSSNQPQTAGRDTKWQII